MKKVVLGMLCFALAACDGRNEENNQGGAPTAESGEGELSGVAPGAKPRDYPEGVSRPSTNVPADAPGTYTSASGASGTPLSGAEAGLSKPEPGSNQQENTRR